MTAANLDEISVATSSGPYAAIRRHFGIRAFGINAYVRREAGKPVMAEHDELGAGAAQHEELYFVFSGHARFTVAGQDADAPAGTFVFVRNPAARRGALALAEDTTVIVVGARRGEPFRISPWEYNAEAFPLFETKEYDRAEQILRGGLGEHPDHPRLLYNLACVESLTGRHEEALEHLGKVVEAEPAFAENARTDPDFDPIRGDPRFPLGADSPAPPSAERSDEALPPTPSASEDSFETAHVSELERVQSFQGVTWLPIRRRFDIRAFGVNAYEGEAGKLVIEEHDELGLGGSGSQEEAYFVAAGSATFTLGNDEMAAPAGTVVFVSDPAARRKAVANEDATVIVVVAGTPGQAYELSAWEWVAPAIAPADAGDFERAAAIVAEGLEHHPDHPSLLYNLACYEVRAGKREAGLAHLAAAVKAAPKTAEWARQDTDFDAVRGNPGFESAIAGES